jgi:hypothetical protein
VLRVLALAQERLLGEVVAVLADGEYRALLPVVRQPELGVGLVLQALLVGDGRGHLLLGLDQLAVHVGDQLVEHLLGVFGRGDQVVDVRANDAGEAVEDAHRLAGLGGGGGGGVRHAVGAGMEVPSGRQHAASSRRWLPRASVMLSKLARNSS